MPRTLRAPLAEFVGTFVFMLIGIGAVVSATGFGVPAGANLVIAFAFGLALATMITVFGSVSGGHFNPAVSLAMWLSGKLELDRLITYVVAQIAGVLAATGLLRIIYTETSWRPSNLGLTAPGAGVSDGKAILIEGVLTFVLVLVIWGAAVDGRAGRAAGLVIGLALFVGHLVGIPLTGAAMNPIRALGPEVVTGTWTSWWVYWVGPIAGAVVASLVYRVAFLAEPDAVVEAPTTPVLEPGPEPVVDRDEDEAPARPARRTTAARKTTTARKTPAARTSTTRRAR